MTECIDILSAAAESGLPVTVSLSGAFVAVEVDFGEAITSFHEMIGDERSLDVGSIVDVELLDKLADVLMGPLIGPANTLDSIEGHDWVGRGNAATPRDLVKMGLENWLDVSCVVIGARGRELYATPNELTGMGEDDDALFWVRFDDLAPAIEWVKGVDVDGLDIRLHLLSVALQHVHVLKAVTATTGVLTLPEGDEACTDALLRHDPATFTSVKLSHGGYTLTLYADCRVVAHADGLIVHDGSVALNPELLRRLTKPLYPDTEEKN